MPLQLENLDDRTYKDLVEEALSMIPNYAPGWTNHNPSDPGITLIEMFAYLTEIMIYRLNRVSDDNVRSFLKLLNGLEWKPSEQKTLTEEIRDTVLKIRRPNRAVTNEDFETLALAADAHIARTRCVPKRNLESDNSLASTMEKPGHVSILIVPESDEPSPKPDSDLIRRVKEYLEPRRLLTTRVHVVGPRYLTLGLQLTLHLKADALESVTKTKAVDALKTFLHPLSGGQDGTGWPFGRNVNVSEIYEILDNQAGVDYVTQTLDQTTNEPLDEIIVDDTDKKRLKRDAQGKLIAVEIQKDELVDAQIDVDDLMIKSPIET